MSRTTKSKKRPGYEWWSRRRFSSRGGCVPSSDMKRLTNRIERRKARQHQNPD